MINPGFFIFAIVSSIFLAQLEIQVESENGWASNLPTWKRKFKILEPLFPEGITGYHFYLFGLIFILIHFRFAFETFTIQSELLNISFFTLVMVLEDFLWFVFNPHFGIKKLNKENVKWFKYWFLGLPINYFIGGFIVIVTYILALKMA